MNKKSDDISYETAEPILMKFHFSFYMIIIQDLAKKKKNKKKTDDDLKFKMAVMSIYGKTHSNDVFSRTSRPIWLIFCMKRMGHCPI